MCHLCGARGNLVTLKRHFGDEVKDAPDTASQHTAILGMAATYYASVNDSNTTEYLQVERGLTAETIAKHQLGFAPGGRTLLQHLRPHFKPVDIVATGLVVERGGRYQDFLQEQITIPYHVNGMVVAVRGKEIGGKYVTPPGTKARLFNVDAAIRAEEVVLTEGEFDALILEQLGFAALGVPGANTFQPRWADYFTDARRVYILFDPDPAGKTGTERVTECLGAKAKPIDIPVPDEVDARDADPSFFVVQQNWGRTDFEDLFRQAARANSILVSVRDAFDEWEELQISSGLKLGFPLLDQALKPGLMPGQVMVPLAKTNCLAPETKLRLNRAGRGFEMSIEDVVERFAGGTTKGKKWNPAIPTRVQRVEADGTIRLAVMTNAWCSGVKSLLRLETTGGRSIRCTAEHPFMVEPGVFRQLGELRPGDQVMVNAGRSATGRKAPVIYRSKGGLRFHPHATRRNLATGGWSVQLHRLVAEAHLNGLSLEEFLARCRTGPVTGLGFLDPSIYDVHHRDHDPQNNRLTNLEVMTVTEHKQAHAGVNVGNVLERAGYDQVASITPCGESVTYDIEVADDPHNFMANDFVVHNTGKTLLLLSFMHRAAMAHATPLRVLFVSLEQTRSEWFERARRIWFFYNPCEPAQNAETWQNVGSTGRVALHHWIDEGTREFWQEKLYIIDRNRVSEEQLHGALAEYKEATGSVPDLVLVDYLGYLAMGYPGNSKYEKTSNAIMSLKSVAKHWRVPIISPHQVSRGAEFGTEFQIDQGRDSGAVEDTADFVLTLWNQDDTKGNKAKRKGELALLIGKSRHGGKGTQLSLQLGTLSLVIVPKEDTLHEQRAAKEAEWNRFGLPWDEAIYHHHLGLRPQVKLPDSPASGSISIPLSF